VRGVGQWSEALVCKRVKIGSGSHECGDKGSATLECSGMQERPAKLTTAQVRIASTLQVLKDGDVRPLVDDGIQEVEAGAIDSSGTPMGIVGTSPGWFGPPNTANELRNATP